MSSRSDLKLDWATHEAARYACEHWHYSRCMPKSKLVKIGVWEKGSFVGVVIFGVGATHQLVSSYGLKPSEGCELVRVALTRHENPVSRIVAVALRMLRKQSPGLRLVVSFADPEQNHTGGIYKAGGWIYTGTSSSSEEFIIQGKRWHGRSLRNSKPFNMTTRAYARSLDPNAVFLMGSAKHRYLMPLCDDVRKRIQPRALPYPKRA